MTSKQKQVLQFIIDYQARHGGVSPSFMEMRGSTGVNSNSGVHRVLISLEERGYIRRAGGRAREITVLRTPDQLPKLSRSENILALSDYLSSKLDVDAAHVRKALMDLPS